MKENTLLHATSLSAPRMRTDVREKTMNYRTAKMSLSIRILTAIILAMVAGFVIGGFYDKNLMVEDPLVQMQGEVFSVSFVQVRSSAGAE